MVTKHRPSWSAWLAAAALLVCAQPPLAAKTKPRKAREVRSAAPSALAPGLVVCEPVASDADPAVAYFGAGCGRWLFFTVGGRPEFGQTPLWSDVERVPRELGRTSLRLPLSDAAKLSNMLGITHVAVGTIKGDAAREILRYQLYAVPSKKPLGPPLTASGTQAQILTQLPVMAQEMMRRLGLTAAPRPAVPDAAPADFALLGQVPWGPDALPTSDQEQALTALAPRLPLAGLLAMNNSLRRDLSPIPVAAHRLIAQSPDSPFIFGQIGYVQAPALAPDAAQVERNIGRYPRNYGFAHVGVWLERVMRDPKREMFFARRMTSAAPRSPAAWLSLGYSLGERGDSIRRGRVAAAISEQEWVTLNDLYAQWLADLKKSIRLDPLYGHAWYQLAQAATFQGQPDVAENAFWKALRFDPNRAEVYSWGMQMFQEKWGGEPATLAKVAHLAAADHYDQAWQALEVAEALGEGGFPDLEKSLLPAAVAQGQADVKQRPDSYAAHFALGQALMMMGQTADAVAEYRQAGSLIPDNALLHYELGQALDKAGQRDEAMSEYQKAIQLDPRNEDAHRDLGWAYKGMGRLDDAKRELNEAIHLNPVDSIAHYTLGLIAEYQNRYSDAVTLFEKALQFAPGWEPALEELVDCCDRAKQYQTGTEAAQAALTVNPSNTRIRDVLADIYLNTRDYANAVAQSQEALRQNPKDAWAHENMGEALLAQGKKDEARAEWEQVLKLDHDQLAKDAQAELTANP